MQDPGRLSWDSASEGGRAWVGLGGSEVHTGWRLYREEGGKEGNQDHVWTGGGAAVQGVIHMSVVGVSS